jgi:hypothetical protein
LRARVRQLVLDGPDFEVNTHCRSRATAFPDVRLLAVRRQMPVAD